MSDAAGPARFPPEELLAHADWARELAAHLVRDPAAAEDVAQDALVAAIEKPPLADRPLRPWLAAVIRKLALARRRGDGRRARREDVVGAAAASKATPSGADVAARLDAHRVLASAVAELPEPLRATVYLRYYEGLDSPEIARRQGVAAETVRWRLAKALAELRARLDARSPGGRGEWLAALAPIAALRPSPPVAPRQTSSAPVAAVLSGVLAMATTMKILLGGAAVVALLALLWSTDVVQFGGSAVAPTQTPSIEAPSSSPSQTQVRDAPAKAPRRRSGAETTTSAPDEPTKTADAPTRTKTEDMRIEVRARVLDFAGAAAAGARVECPDGADAPGADADADGRVSFFVSADVAVVSLEFVVSAARCATRAVDGTPPREGGVLDLGDVRLAAGGAVAGRVVDAAGAAIAGAWVGVVDADVEYVRAAPRAESDADGRFVIRGVPVGRPQIAAGKKGFQTKRLAVDVRPSEETSGAVLVVDRDDPAIRVRGVVRTPDGAAAPRAIVTYRYEGGGGTGSGSTSADADGGFDIQGGREKAWRLSARDAEGRWSASAAVEVRSGADAVELRLTEARWVDLRVTRGDGKPAERYEVMIQALDGLVLDRLGEDVRADGLARVKLPSQTFAVVVTAPGCAVATAGPFDPSKLNSRIEVRAAPLPGLRGRVTAAGAPVAKARVTLRALVAPGMREIRNGFACLTSSAMGEVRADTDADGAFELTLRQAGRFVLRAEAPDFAAAEAGPFEVTPEVGRTGIAIILTTGGAIEGRVLVGPGKTVDGVIVGASRGDGEARTIRVGPDGAFRFDRLTPGQWLVKKTDREIRGGAVSVMTTVGEARFDWSCKVDDGATTHFDVDLRVEAGTPVRGDIRVDGAPAAGWKVTLFAGPGLFTSEEVAAGSVPESGAFRLVAPRTGDHFVCAMSPQGLRLMAPVKVGDAEASLSLDVATGHVTVRGAASGDPLLLFWDGAGGRCAFAETGVGADGTSGPTRFPAGRVRLVRPTPSEADPRKWPTVVEGDLVAGGTLALEVPAK